MPSELHGELARAAERDGTSLNQFITRALAQTLGWEGDGLPSSRAHGPHRRDVTTIVLVANAVAVGTAAVAAIAILLFAWLA
jgi:hypothetical protein